MQGAEGADRKRASFLIGFFYLLEVPEKYVENNKVRNGVFLRPEMHVSSFQAKTTEIRVPNYQ